MDAKGTDKIKEEPSPRDPYLSYEQYENLLYRGKTHPQLSQQLAKPEMEGTINDQIPIDSLISEIHYDDPASPTSLTTLSSLSAPLPAALPPSMQPTMPLTSSIDASLPNQLASSLSHPLAQPLSPISALAATPPINMNSQPTQLSLIALHSPPPPPNTAQAVALLNTAESQKIQRKKANQQEREILEKYYNDHYIDQSVKIRKEDLTELAFTLNWHVLRVQGWMHTHRQSRSDYNPPKRTKRRATLPQEQDILKHYFKIWTEQGLIDLHSPTRVTPKDYEVVANQLGWDNERVRRWTDHYKQKIKAATEGNP
jgi:hypothetical protein